MNTTTKTTNRWIANALGVSEATVSRLRSGDRNPSFAVMAKIADTFGWPIASQSTARVQGRWHLGFEGVCHKINAKSAKNPRHKTNG